MAESETEDEEDDGATDDARSVRASPAPSLPSPASARGSRSTSVAHLLPVPPVVVPGTANKMLAIPLPPVRMARPARKPVPPKKESVAVPKPDVVAPIVRKRAAGRPRKVDVKLQQTTYRESAADTLYFDVMSGKVPRIDAEPRQISRASDEASSTDCDEHLCWREALLTLIDTDDDSDDEWTPERFGEDVESDKMQVDVEELLMDLQSLDERLPYVLQRPPPHFILTDTGLVAPIYPISGKGCQFSRSASSARTSASMAVEDADATEDEDEEEPAEMTHDHQAVTVKGKLIDAVPVDDGAPVESRLIDVLSYLDLRHQHALVGLDARELYDRCLYGPLRDTSIVVSEKTRHQLQALITRAESNVALTPVAACQPDANPFAWEFWACRWDPSAFAYQT